MRICVVGGGVAGVQAADILNQKGHEITIFDAADGPGGVWRKNYDGYALQVPSELYEFPGMRHTNQSGYFPQGRDVLAYIERYIDERNLFTRCDFRFNEMVTGIDEGETAAWSVVTDKSTYTFDFCVMATGMYHTPNIPAELKPYNPIHSSNFVDASCTANKNVVVVGGGKSAIDCAVQAAKHATQVTMLVREMHWPVPRYILGLIPFKWGTYSRLGHSLLPPHWVLTPRERVWHDFAHSIKRFVWRLLERVFAFQFGLESRPRIPLEIDLFNGGQILTYDLRNAIRDHKIDWRTTSEMTPEDVSNILKNSDLVICGTGFKNSYGVFSARVQSKLNIESDGLWLYKNMIPPKCPNLAFIGSEVSTFNNILTQNLQSRWLASQMQDLPSRETMETYVNSEQDWKRQWMPESASRASMIQLHMTKYHDILMDDCNVRRKKNRWWEWVLPLTARDYE